MCVCERGGMRCRGVGKRGGRCECVCGGVGVSKGFEDGCRECGGVDGEELVFEAGGSCPIL